MAPGLARLLALLTLLALLAAPGPDSALALEGDAGVRAAVSAALHGQGGVGAGAAKKSKVPTRAPTYPKAPNCPPYSSPTSDVGALCLEVDETKNVVDYQCQCTGGTTCTGGPSTGVLENGDSIQQYFCQ